MRKDLKIGMAIGAVLLVVLIVYLAVPDNSTDVAQDTGTEQVSEPTESVAPVETPTAHEETPVAETPVDVKPPVTPLVKGEVATADKPEKDDPFASQGSMWANILKTGEMTPLRATTPGAEVTGAAPAETTTTTPKVEEPATESPTPTAENTVAVDPNSKTETTAPEATAPEPEKPAEAVADAKAAGARTHTVKAGEDFSKIAREAYGDGRLYLAIVKANPTIEPTRLKPGTVIVLPEIASTGAEPAAKTATGSVTAKREKDLDPEKEYRIQSGDSLYKISMKHYGTSNMVETLYDANKSTIGNDSSRLKLGSVIKLPPAPGGTGSR